MAYGRAVCARSPYIVANLWLTNILTLSSYSNIEGGRQAGREGGVKEVREGGRKGGREGGREGRKQGGKEAGR